MREFPILKELPEEYAVGVGLVIAKWAYQEWLLIQVLRAILGIEPKEARHVFGTAEGVDYAKLIRTLLELQGLKSSIDLSDFRNRLRDLREERNVVAHGLWLKDPDTGTPKIQAISGVWEEEKVTRKLKPEAMQFDREDANVSSAESTIRSN